MDDFKKGHLRDLERDLQRFEQMAEANDHLAEDEDDEDRADLFRNIAKDARADADEIRREIEDLRGRELTRKDLMRRSR